MKDTTVRICRCGAALAAIILLTGAVGEARDLGIEERIEAQKAIERVYYAHQIGATRPFEEAIPRAALEKKVRTYLKQSAALETFWRTPVTAEMLRKELQRMDAHTRMPERLQELYAALGNDPFLIQECLARPALVDRLARNFFAYDATIHAKARQEAEALRDDLARHHLDPRAKHPRRTLLELVRLKDVEGRRGSDQHARPLAGMEENRTHLELQRVEFDRYRARLPSHVGEIGPVQEDHEFFVTRVLLGESEGEIEVAAFVVPKTSWDVWWSSVENHLDAEVSADGPSPLSVSDRSESLFDQPCLGYDSWDNGSLDDTLETRYDHSAVWTGSLMVIWGGYDGSHLDSGSRYDPATDIWTAISTTNAPAARSSHTAVWTGAQMIVWGGVGGDPYALNSMGKYDPSTDTWAPTSTGANVPEGRYGHTAVWTGTEMIVWGGWDGEFAPEGGGRYLPSADTWTPISIHDVPDQRIGHTAVWTGTEMIVWGGQVLVGYGQCCPITGCYDCPLYQIQNTGIRYHPSTNSWTPISTGANVPGARMNHIAAWTGTEMIVWGGNNGYGTYLATGGRYHPMTDSWTSTSTAGSPTGRQLHTAVWTGSLMVVWGGSDGSNLDSGGRYSPAVDAWTPTSTTGAPSGRQGHTAVWTGRLMIVWGGGPGGGRYVVDPSVDDDGDGISECGDCDDSNPAIYPGAREDCDALDNDCDGTADEFATSCGVGQCSSVGTCTAGVDSCLPGSPAQEICDSVDNNCDGIVDNAAVPVDSPFTEINVFGQTAVLGWDILAGATGYDVVKGSLGILRSSGGAFDSAIQGCLANDLGESALVLSDSPAIGEGIFYLVRGINCGGPGTYDSTGPAQVGSRDAEIAASPLSCP